MSSVPAEPSGVIVLLSGGLDSTVALAEVVTRRPVIRALTFDYGQRAAPKERAAAKALAAHYRLAHEVIALPWLSALLPLAMRSPLAMKGTRKQQDPPLSREEWFEVERVWVPNRNGLFLNIAACYAEALQATTVVFGANAEEGAAFPDNTPAFRDALNHVLTYSTLSGVQVETPVGNLDKEAIIQKGQALDVPWHLIWSCYEGAEVQCGQCASCLRVKEARDRVVSAGGQRAAMAFKSE